MRTTVGVDVGCHRHRVAIADPGGKIVEEFDLPARWEGFRDFFARLEHYRTSYGVPVVVAMEGYNGYARPLDREIQERGYTLLNVNNLKLRRFKELFPSPAKTDAIDARKIVELVRLQGSLPRSREILQEVSEVPEAHRMLKRLTRRRRQLVDEKVSLLNRMQSDLQAVSPGLADLVEYKDGVAFLRFLSCRNRLEQLKNIRRESLLKIRGIGKSFAGKVQAWQKEACFSAEAPYVGPMIIEDARRILELKERITGLEEQIGELSESSPLGRRIGSIPGFGVVSTGELVGEIGTMDRFDSESSLAMYLGMAPLDNSSGSYQGTKTARQVNRRARMAMMTATMRHIPQVEESRSYYERKRNEGKTYHQAVRATGRHLVRVIWSMVKRGEDYHIRQLHHLTENPPEPVVTS
jgi:transposase